MIKRDPVSTVIIFLVLFVVSFLFIIPFIWTALTSIKTDPEIYSFDMVIIPSVVTFEHYARVVTRMGAFLLFFRNSVITAFWSVLGVTVLSTTMGYAFSKLYFKFKSFFLGFILFVLTLPYVIYLIPIYIMQARFDLINTHLGLVLPYIALYLPLAVFIMRGQFNNIPSSMGDAATIDGCNSFDVFARVMLPMVKPGIATVIIFTFINVWGEFTYGRTLTSTTRAQTLPVGITFLRDEATAWQFGTLTATIVLSLIPVLIIFLSMQKYFIKGIMEGALKG